MAKTSKIVKNKQREALVEKYAARRAELTQIMKDPNASWEQKFQALSALEKLPRNSAKVRVRNRCNLTGRPRAYYRKFGLCRIAFREQALLGNVPGVVKSSW
ncbi:MAG: 30S ribosomal protein S14 [Myxococcales bacterium]|nr:30S ribosomal protein S14 [Myxococcales bacterium]MCB9521756.1 30S ribosomal protein S14 [Myxococcales bacterium]